MISWAQNLEDVMLARAFKGTARGYYVDVGAYDPVIDSVTRHFYEAGWHGINIEPHSIHESSATASMTLLARRIISMISRSSCPTSRR